MITMDVKGITWVGNMYQKFENMCLEVEEMMYEDTVKYIEDQVQTVGASVKKFYSDVVQDLLPPSCDLDEKVASELPLNQDADIGVCEESVLVSKERPVKFDTKQTTKDSRINHDVDNDVTYNASCDKSWETDALFTSTSGNSVKRNKFDLHSKQYVESTHIKSSLGINESRQSKEVPPTKRLGEIMSRETDTCRTSSYCELSNENHRAQYHDAATFSKPASAEATRMDSVADCCDEIEDSSVEQIPSVPKFVESAEDLEMNTSPSSSAVLFGELKDTWGWDATEVDTDIEQDHETMQQDDNELKLEETCVMVSGDELQLVPKSVDNLIRTKKMRQTFSFRKKSARKQEYEQLAVWHGSNGKGKGDCLENTIPTSELEDQKKLLLSNVTEPEWELL